MMGVRKDSRAVVKQGWQAKLLLSLLALLFGACLTACSSISSSHEDISLHIKEPGDINRLRTMEASLAINPDPAPPIGDLQQVQNTAIPYLPEYRMGPGDVIEIVYHIRYDRSDQEYHIEIQDKISVTFPYHPQFSTTAVVRTDGKITVPLIGDVRAESLTPPDLAAALNREYSKYVSNPSITVAMESFNIKIDELKKAITTAPRGQSKIAPILPDGRVSFPIVGPMSAGGLTVSQLEQMVNEKYSEYIRNLNCTIILLEIHHAKFYMVGEIMRPGVYEMTSQVSLLDAIAMAGGHKPTACMSDILVFRNDGLERPIAFKVDLETLLTKKGTHLNVPLKPADIIYVPKTRIDHFDDVVAKVFTKGLYAVLPFQTVFSINYDINNPIIK
jgi:polysaccharide biosynthesis/export protein